MTFSRCLRRPHRHRPLPASVSPSAPWQARTRRCRQTSRSESLAQIWIYPADCQSLGRGEASRRSSAPGSLLSAVSGGLRALCKVAAPRLARGLEAFVCRSTPGNQGAQRQLQVRPRGDPGDSELGHRGLNFPFGRMGTGADSATELGPAGPARFRISTWELHASARERILAPGIRSARSRTQTHPWDARTTGCTSLAPSASVSTSAQWGRRLLSPSPSTSPTGQGVPGDRGWSLAGLPAVFGQEAWPCCWVTREVGRCCSEICVRLVHQATIPRPGASELRAVPGCLTQVFPFYTSLYCRAG